MTYDEMDSRRLDDVRDCLALLRAYTEENNEGIETILGQASQRDLTCCMAGIVLGVLTYCARTDAVAWIHGEQDYIRQLLARAA